MVILTIITWLRLLSTWVLGLSLSSARAVTRVQIWTRSNWTWDRTLISVKMNLGSGLSSFLLNLSSGLISSSDWNPIEFRIQDGVSSIFRTKWTIEMKNRRLSLLWPEGLPAVNSTFMKYKIFYWVFSFFIFLFFFFYISQTFLQQLVSGGQSGKPSLVCFVKLFWRT